MLIPIKYHEKSYPDHILPKIDEISGHFDISKISATREFSLHTEYSYGKRCLTSEFLKHLPAIRDSHNQGVPKLWYSNEWAIEFAEFIKLICNGKKPAIIEIHPPFSDYTESIDSFLNIYKQFEEVIIDYLPNTKILIENRSGSIYIGGKFIISNGNELNNLCSKILGRKLQLRITLDIPQLLTAYGGPQVLDCKSITSILNEQKILQPMIDGIHLWGKKRSASGRVVSHSGDLNTYFESTPKKEVFLEWLSVFLQDKRPRYFVPEVNSTDEDLFSIVSDLESKDIKFG